MPSASHMRDIQEGSGNGSKDRKQNGRWRTSRSMFMAGLFIVATLVAWRGTRIGRERSELTHRFCAVVGARRKGRTPEPVAVKPGDVLEATAESFARDLVTAHERRSKRIQGSMQEHVFARLDTRPIDGSRGKGRTADCPPGVGTGQGTRGKASRGPEGEDGCQEALVSNPRENGPASAVQGALDAKGTIGRSDIGEGQGQGGVNGNLPQAEARCINTSRLASGESGGENGGAGLPCAEASLVKPASETVREVEKAGCVGRKIVFIKSYKTGSTTLSTYLTQIGCQDAAVGGGCYFMHPEAAGMFNDGELEARLREGQRFDMSVRHITPRTPYETLVKLVPGAAFISIMRNPMDRFLSLFNFRHELKRIYKTPEVLIKAIEEGKVSKGDSRPFCNQLAWLLSGEDVDYTGVDSQEEAERVANEVIATASKWNVTILLTERMSDSIVLLADRMGWDMEKLELRLGSHRVQKRTQPTPRKSQGYYYTCAAAENPTSSKHCEEAIRRCNKVDDVLYSHYKRRFDEIFTGLVDARKAVKLLEDKPEAMKMMSSLESGNYPINCVEEGSAGLHPSAEAAAGGGSVPDTERQTYNRLHSCRGRPYR